MFNVPDDCANHPAAPWNDPDAVTAMLCQSCDELVAECQCADGPDAIEREVEPALCWLCDNNPCECV